MSTRPPVGILATSALLLSGVLSGCGTAGTGFHPGVAAQVGDDQITVSHVDEVTGNYCSAIQQQLSADNQVLPLRFLRSGIAGQLALARPRSSSPPSTPSSPAASTTRRSPSSRVPSRPCPRSSRTR